MEIRTDMCDHLAALALAVPAATDEQAGVDEIILSDLQSAAAQEREEYAHQLRLAMEADVDPVLHEIEVARAQMLAAERRLRLLVAYGREFVRPRPYRLEDLARAAGMSISGVRTAYTDDEIDDVAERTGVKARRPTGGIDG
jgi:hypothetical protein